MKYIVDIPKELVTEIQNSPCYLSTLEEVIADTATPFDSFIEGIKGEIRKMPNRNPSYTHTCDVVDREDVLDIIDNHIKAGE